MGPYVALASAVAQSDAGSWLTWQGEMFGWKKNLFLW